MKISTIAELQRIIIDFRNKRDWKQFHNPKDLSLSLVLEAAELTEHFQWKSSEEIKVYVKKNKAQIGDELADVFYWVLLMSHDLQIDIVAALKQKIRQNARKYPIQKAKGNAKKYTEFRP